MKTRISMNEKIEIAKKYMPNKGWVSPTIIGALIKIGGHSSIGSPVCKKMVELGIAERNENGHYRLIEPSND